MCSSTQSTTRAPSLKSVINYISRWAVGGCEGPALKITAGWSDRVVSALWNQVHYVVNYVFEGRTLQDPAAGGWWGWLWDACGQTWGRSKEELPVSPQKHPPTTPIKGNVRPLTRHSPSASYLSINPSNASPRPAFWQKLRVFVSGGACISSPKCLSYKWARQKQALSVANGSSSFESCQDDGPSQVGI